MANTQDLLHWIERLRVLTPADWMRITAAVDDQRGESIQALWRRAAHRRLWLASITPRFRFASQLAFAVGQLAQEFAAPRDIASDTRRFREAAVRKGTAFAGAIADVAEVACAALPHDVIAYEAVLIAAHAVARRAETAPDLFSASYAPMAGVLPLPAP